jgi:hypothetical protein
VNPRRAAQEKYRAALDLQVAEQKQRRKEEEDKRVIETNKIHATASRAHHPDWFQSSRLSEEYLEDPKPQSQAQQCQQNYQQQNQPNVAQLHQQATYSTSAPQISIQGGGESNMASAMHQYNSIPQYSQAQAQKQQFAPEQFYEPRNKLFSILTTG